jgi:predicted metal-dependent hydrolase
MELEASFTDVPRHFAQEGDLILSHLAAALSAVFPDGEDFFVRSVRRFRDQVTEPELKRQVAGFIGQEAVHGREHRAFNSRLDALGYPTKRVERFVRKGLAVRERILSPKSNLAATAALEHFTATLAELVLTNEAARDLFGHEAVRDLFVWHALEESEHKAVAFDVYRAVGGTERMRVWTMKVIRIAFLVGIVVQMVLSLAKDPATYERGRLRRSLQGIGGSKLASRQLWDQLREYDRPGFHPNDRDTNALVEHWRAALFGEDGALTSQLAGSAA